MEKLILVAVIAGAGYWYWSGPYQERVNPSYDAILEENARNMSECMRAAAYQRGATGAGPAPDSAREQCAEKYNVYEQEGQWYRYDMNRPES